MSETQKAISESLGCMPMSGLKDSNGGNLEPIQVPSLNAFAVLRLQSRVFDKFMKVAEVLKQEEAKTDTAKVLASIYDEEGLQLQSDILCSAFNTTENELGLRFDADSLNHIYAAILRRDFDITELANSFVTRFTEMFGGASENPPTSPEPS